MPTRSRRAILLAIAVLCCAAVPAMAAPSFDATLSASATTFTWDGGPGNGFNKTEALEYTPCGSPSHDCEDVLVKLEVPGALVAEIASPEEESVDPGDTANTHDLDLQLWESDAAGTPSKQLVGTQSTSSQEKITKKGLKAGFYIVRVDFYRAVNATYSGSLNFTAADVAPPAAAPVVTVPAPVAAPAPKPASKKKSAKTKRKIAACKKKAKRIKSAKKRRAALKRCAKIKR